MADDKTKDNGEAKPKTRVEVLADNLGPNLLKKGEITDDPQIVALLNKPGGEKLVRAVGENC